MCMLTRSHLTQSGRCTKKQSAPLLLVNVNYVHAVAAATLLTGTNHISSSSIESTETQLALFDHHLPDNLLN